MRVSKEGLDLIKSSEGFRPKAYYCPAGKLTIGNGTVITPSMDARYRTSSITEEEATKLLADHVDQQIEQRLNREIKNATQGQWDAFVDFAYNLGVEALLGSTLMKYFRAGKFVEAANEFQKWNKAGGKVLPGLVSRREAERRLFVKN